MERRNFLKNILGAGLITILPIPVFEALVMAPAPTQNTWSKLQNGLWLLDNNEIIEFTSKFSLNIMPNAIDITSVEDVKNVYMFGPPSWNISDARFPRPILVSLYDDYFLEGKPLTAVVLYKKIRIYGEVFITEINTELIGDINFQGLGALIKEEK